MCKKQPITALLLGFMLLLFGFSVINVLGWSWLASLYGREITEIGDLLGDVRQYPANKQLVLAIVAITQLATWGFAGFVMMLIVNRPPTAITSRTRITLYAGVLMMFAAIPLIQALAFDAKSFSLSENWMEWEIWMKQREKESFEMLKVFIATTSIRDLLINILILALVPAVCEEMFFRGFLQKTLSFRFSPITALLLSAFIFSLLHFQFYGFFSRFVLGCVLGYLFMLSDNVTPGIIAHFAYNSLMVFVGYIYTLSGVEIPNEDTGGIAFPWYWVLISAGLLAFLAWNTWNAVKEKKD